MICFPLKANIRKKKYIDAVTPNASMEYILPSKAYMKKKGFRIVAIAANNPVFLLQIIEAIR